MFIRHIFGFRLSLATNAKIPGRIQAPRALSPKESFAHRICEGSSRTEITYLAAGSGNPDGEYVEPRVCTQRTRGRACTHTRTAARALAYLRPS